VAHVAPVQPLAQVQLFGEEHIPPFKQGEVQTAV